MTGCRVLEAGPDLLPPGASRPTRIGSTRLVRLLAQLRHARPAGSRASTIAHQELPPDRLPLALLERRVRLVDPHGLDGGEDIQHEDPRDHGIIAAVSRL